MKKILSIIIPVYNTGKFLEKCIDSIELREDFEVIIVDDCSTDEFTRNILKKVDLEHEEIKIIYLDTNGRQGHARNVGIQHSTGEYIAFVDSDDYIEKNRFSTLLENRKNMRYEIIYSELLVGADDDFNTVFSEGNIEELDSMEEIRKRLIYNGISVVRPIYSSHIIKDYGLYFPENIFFEDNYWVALVTYYADFFTFVKDVPYYYIRHDAQTTSNFNMVKLEERLISAKLLLEEIKKPCYRSEFEILEARFIKLFLINSVQWMNNDNFTIDDYLEIKREILVIDPNCFKNKIIIENDIVSKNSMSKWNKCNVDFVNDLFKEFGYVYSSKGDHEKIN